MCLKCGGTGIFEPPQRSYASGGSRPDFGRSREVQSETGVVKWFNTTKGFGFIAPDGGGDDVHVNGKNVDGNTLGQGDRVSFERRSGSKGPWAANVRKI